MPENNIDGALAAALAKAQATFPAIPKDKEVTVTSKSGASYKFKYAPLDSILSATRKPLTDNGLALLQLLDSDADGAPALVTRLIHSAGGSVTGRTPIPATEGSVQAFGSAITYLRRYAIQAILGIAAEEDDDGNQAAGNSATFARPAPPHLPPRADPATADPPPPDAKTPYAETTDLIGRERRQGIIRKGTSNHYKLEPHIGPEGSVLGFKLDTGKGNIPQCVTTGALGDKLMLATGGKPESLVGQRATVAGKLLYVKGNKTSEGWYRLEVDTFENDEWVLTAEAEPVLPEPPEDVPLLGEAESAPLGLT